MSGDLAFLAPLFPVLQQHQLRAALSAGMEIRIKEFIAHEQKPHENLMLQKAQI